jgi:hypothetical protein
MTASMTASEARDNAERMLAGAFGVVQVVIPAGRRSEIRARGRIVIHPQHDIWSVPATIRCKTFAVVVDLVECMVHDDGVRTVVTLPRVPSIHLSRAGEATL